jgi:2-polyprenyl-3-methyl-5-hydroxy-6-metoxy-1,4-benzoquinol methylase
MNITKPVRLVRNAVARVLEWPKKGYVQTKQAQNEVLTNSANPYYESHYRNCEYWYWSKIPEWILALRASHAKANILDIGGGYGTLSAFCGNVIESPSLHAIDFTGEYLSPELIKSKSIDFRVCNIELEEIPWNVKFDIVIFTEVIEHLNFNPTPTLNKIRKSLSNNGKIFLSTPDALEWGRISKYFESLEQMPQPTHGSNIIDDHVWQYEKTELVRLIEQCGLQVDKFGYSPGTPNRHLNFQLSRKPTHS